MFLLGRRLRDVRSARSRQSMASSFDDVTRHSRWSPAKRVHPLRVLPPVHGDELVHSQLHACQDHPAVARACPQPIGLGFERTATRAPRWARVRAADRAVKARAHYSDVGHRGQRARAEGSRHCGCAEPVVSFLHGLGNRRTAIISSRANGLSRFVSSRRWLLLLFENMVYASGRGIGARAWNDHCVSPARVSTVRCRGSVPRAIGTFLPSGNPPTIPCANWRRGLTSTSAHRGLFRVQPAHRSGVTKV